MTDPIARALAAAERMAETVVKRRALDVRWCGCCGARSYDALELHNDDCPVAEFRAAMAQVTREREKS